MRRAAKRQGLITVYFLPSAVLKLDRPVPLTTISESYSGFSFSATRISESLLWITFK